jgi:hypothetical protein
VVNEVLGTTLVDHAEDVETIPHPKNLLKRLASGFHEKKHGKLIVPRLDLRHILSRPDTCASLRTMFAWCTKALGKPFSEEYRLQDGKYNAMTSSQLDTLS